MIRILALSLFLTFFSSLQAQEDGKSRFARIETFKIEAQVVSTLEGRNDLAVLQIIDADKNEWGLKTSDEVLVTFHYSTKKNNEFPGVKAGDIIRADLYGERNKNTVQMDYTLFRYVVTAQPKGSKVIPSDR